MAMSEPPHAAFAPVDHCDAQRLRLHRPTFDGEDGAFQPGDDPEVPAHLSVQHLDPGAAAPGQPCRGAFEGRK
jgi:hypothetical protein